MRYIFLNAVLLSLFGCASLQVPFLSPRLPDGITHVSEHQSQKGVPSITYQKYVLDNGLTVVLHPDKSDPLVRVDMTYHVGSARELPGQSGFAHFFEHMMFQGSKHVKDQEHFKTVTASGGIVNGSTNRDRTNYYQTVPANELEKMLWLESDRMGFLLEAVSQRKFEIQRDTVKNERAQSYENRPYGLVQEALIAALYPANHPYSWSTIGHVDDLNRVDVSALKSFFLRWYGPNNATLTIGGDINVEQTLSWIQKYFGDIPRGPDVLPADKWPVKIEQDRFVTIEDKIEQSMLVMSWPTQYPLASSKLSLDMLASVLGQGRNSVLYQSLVKTGKVLSASVYQNCAELSCSFQLYVLANQGGDLKTVRKDVLKVLDSLKERGIKQSDLLQVKGMAEADAVFSLQSVAGKVSQLAENETFYGEPERLSHWLKQLNAVSVKDVEGAFEQFVWNKPSVNVSVVPLGKKRLQAHAQNFSSLKAHIDPRLIAQMDKDALMRETPETFDRTQPPPSAAGVTVKIPELYYSTLSNGIQITGAIATETPTIALHLLFPAGALMEPKGKNGLAYLTSSLISEGTTKQSSEEISAQLDVLGSSVEMMTSSKSTVLNVLSLTKNLTPTLKIAEQMLFSPRFAQKDFDRIKKQMLESIQMDPLNPNWLAGQAKRDVFFQDPWHALPSDGTKESITNLTLKDVKDFYKNNYTPDKAQLIVVGDIDKKTLLTEITPLQKWKGPRAKKAMSAVLKKQTQPHIWILDNPGATQTSVQMVRIAMPYDATGEMFKTQLANFNLAGNFNSRLNLNLREDKGFTYGARGWISGDDESGFITFQTQVRAQTTLDTIKEMQKELKKMQSEGITDEEMDFLRLASGQKDALSYETPSDKAQLIANIVRFHLPVNYKTMQKEMIASVSKESLNQLAKKWFDPMDYQLIIVGDAKALEPNLKTLGLPIKRLHLKK